MNKVEKANRRAREAIIAYLVASEQSQDAEAEASILEWDKLPYPALIDAMNYNLTHSAYRNAVVTRHMRRCIRMAEQARLAASEKQLMEVGA